MREGFRRVLGGVVALAMVATPAMLAGQIRPGTVFQDTSGMPVEAHGGGMIQVGKTFYWIGENKSENKSMFFANSCYSSSDLQHWTFVGNALSRQTDGDLGPDRVVERPKILYNRATKQFVLWMHIDSKNYKEAKVGVATSKSVCGPYSYRESFQPLGFQSRDMGLFQDKDGTAYLLTEDREHGLRIDLLSRDYLSVVKTVAVLPDMEAPAMVHVGPTYFLFSSFLSGWKANDNQYTTAPSPAGPWAPMRPFAPAGTNTFQSQTAYVLPVTGRKGTTYIYMGDRWNPKDFPGSGYVWLPLKLSGQDVTMEWVDAWTPDVSAGTWAPASDASSR